MTGTPFRKDLSERTLGWVLLAPAFVLLAVIVVYPIGALFWNSLHGVDHAEGGHQLTARVHRDHEFAAGRIGYVLGEGFAGAEHGVERLREARGQAPADLLLGVDDGRGGTGCQNAGHAGALQEFTTFHDLSSKRG